jgi:hypothetical protein
MSENGKFYQKTLPNFALRLGSFMKYDDIAFDRNSGDDAKAEIRLNSDQATL